MLARRANVRTSEGGIDREEGPGQGAKARGEGLTVPTDRAAIGKATYSGLRTDTQVDRHRNLP